MHPLSAHAFKKAFCEGKLSAEAIVEQTLEKISHHDHKVGAFLNVLSDRARKKAHALDQKKKAGKPLGKLAGVPIALKDNIHIAGEITTCASRFLENYRAPFDATVVKLLEQEDALLIGKTNLDEFAMGSSTENSAFHPTKNPWNLHCSPGGSSGGSAAAVAARMCPIALGTDTGGSIRQPASFCGIVGFKPTYGRVSRYGLVAFGSSLDQIGPLAHHVSDAALVMEVIGKHCQHDSTSIDLKPEHYCEKMQAGIQGTRIGVPWHFLEKMHDNAKEHFIKATEIYKSLGAEIVDVNLDLQQYAVAAYYILATAEASTNLARFDGIRYGKRSARAATLEEIYQFSKQEGFGREVKKRILLGTYVLSSGFQDAYYRKAQKVRTLMIRQFKEAFEKCQVIALPTCPARAFCVGEINDPIQMYLQDIFTIAANLAGLPAISIPCGFLEDLPLGLQILAPQMQDARVFQYAHAFDQVTRFSEKIPPLFAE